MMAPDTYQSRANHRMLELQGVRLASFRSRAFAFIIDIMVVVASLSLLTLAVVVVAKELGLMSKEARFSLQFDFKNWYSLASIVVYFGLATYWWDGRTVGKRIMRIQVVSTLETRLKFWQSISRSLGYATSALQLGYGFLVYFVAENRLTTHDRIAGTIVVKSPMELTQKTGSGLNPVGPV